MESFSAQARPRARSISISERSSATAGTTFTRVTKWVKSARFGQHHRRIGTGVVLRAQLRKRRGDIAAHQRLEQLDHPHPVGEPQHLPHILARTGPAACAIA